MHGKLGNMRVAHKGGAQASGAEEAQENCAAHGRVHAYLLLIVNDLQLLLMLRQK